VKSQNIKVRQYRVGCALLVIWAVVQASDGSMNMNVVNRNALSTLSYEFTEFSTDLESLDSLENAINSFNSNGACNLDMMLVLVPVLEKLCLE
jgi:hypothetical protein